MQEQTIFVADDGERFDSAEDCQAWEKLASKYEQVRNVNLFGARDPDDEDSGQEEGFPPQRVQDFLDLRLWKDLAKTLGDELFPRPGIEFVETAKQLKAISDWLWD